MNCVATSHERQHSVNAVCYCLPPEERVDSEYLCRPAPKVKPRTAPALGPNRLTHYFLSPECIRPEQETVYAQLPKRLGRLGPLKATPQKEVLGWGIHIEEGYHKRAAFLLFATLVLFSAIFGIVWSVKRGDIQGGFAVTGCVLTFCSMLVGFIVVR